MSRFAHCLAFVRSTKKSIGDLSNSYSVAINVRSHGSHIHHHGCIDDIDGDAQPDALCLLFGDRSKVTQQESPSRNLNTLL